MAAMTRCVILLLLLVASVGVSASETTTERNSTIRQHHSILEQDEAIQRFLPFVHGSNTLHQDNSNESENSINDLGLTAAGPIHHIIAKSISPDLSPTNESGRTAFAMDDVHVTVLDSDHGRIPVHIEGSSYTVIEFSGHKGNTINMVAQILEHRYSGDVSIHNCQGMQLNLQLRSKWSLPSSTTLGFDDNMGKYNAVTTRAPYPHPRSEDGSQSGSDPDTFANGGTGWGAVWDSFAQMFDTSAFCRVLPSLSLRINKATTSEPYFVVIRSIAPSINPTTSSPPTCDLEVYISQVSWSWLRQVQLIFALFLPLLIVVVPLPWLLWRAEFIGDFMGDSDFAEWLWAPPYYLRHRGISIIRGTFTYVQNYRAMRRNLRQQQRLEIQRQELMQQQPLQASTSDAAGADGSQLIRNNHPTLDSSTEAETSEQQPHQHTISFSEHADNPRESLLLSSEHHDGSKSSRKVAEEDHEALEHHFCEREEARDAVDGAHTLLFTEGAASPTKASTGDMATVKVEDDEERVCRICRDGDEDEPLVAPCVCTGSVRWIHRSCLDRWRIESANRNLANVNNCEICKQPFNLGISKGTLFLQSSEHFFKGILLFLGCFMWLVIISYAAYGVAGELSCMANYHHVSYTTMFTFEGFVVTFFLYGLTVLMVLFSFAVVVSWFRNRPEVLEYEREMHHLPPFWTRRQMVLLAMVCCIVTAQVLSLGYLIKLLTYSGSNAAWNWEISPMVGGVFYALIINLGMGISQGLRELFSRRQRTAAVDVVIEATTTAPAAAPPGTSAAPSAAATSWEQSIQRTVVDYSQQFDIPAEQRVIRAMEYCPPRRTV